MKNFKLIKIKFLLNNFLFKGGDRGGFGRGGRGGFGEKRSFGGDNHNAGNKKIKFDDE